MVSTRNSVNARVEGLRSGADDYLGKPYDAEELRARVEVLLRTRAAFDERPATYPQAPSWAGGSTADVGRGRGGAGAGRGRQRGGLRRRMQEEFERAERYSDPLACLRVEVDDASSGRRGRPSRSTVARCGASSRGTCGRSTWWSEDRRSRVPAGPAQHALPGGADGGGAHLAGGAAPAGARWTRASRCRSGCRSSRTRTRKTLQDMLELVDAALERARREQGGKICLFQHQGYLCTLRRLTSGLDARAPPDPIPRAVRPVLSARGRSGARHAGCGRSSTAAGGRGRGRRCRPASRGPGSTEVRDRCRTRRRSRGSTWSSRSAATGRCCARAAGRRRRGSRCWGSTSASSGS
jgi:two-component system cell cycle response regulator